MEGKRKAAAAELARVQREIEELKLSARRPRRPTHPVPPGLTRAWWQLSFYPWRFRTRIRPL